MDYSIKLDLTCQFPQKLEGLLNCGNLGFHMDNGEGEGRAANSNPFEAPVFWSLKPLGLLNTTNNHQKMSNGNMKTGH